MKKEVTSKTLVISNLILFVGLFFGLWSINVGMGLGLQTQVPADGIVGLMLIAASILLSCLLLIVAVIRKETGIFLYVFPLLSLAIFAGFIYFNRPK